MNQEPQNDDYQDWIDSLLTSSEAQAPTPASLHHRIENRFRQHRRQSIFWKSTAALTAVAASIALLIAFQTDETLSPHTIAAQTESAPTITPETPTIPPAITSASFTPRSDLVAVPIASNDPQVTIVQVYQTTQTRRRQQRKASLQALNTHLQQFQQHLQQHNQGG